MNETFEIRFNDYNTVQLDFLEANNALVLQRRVFNCLSVNTFSYGASALIFIFDPTFR